MAARVCQLPEHKHFAESCCCLCMGHATGHLQCQCYPIACCCKGGLLRANFLDASAESEAQQDVLRSFGDAKGLAFSKDGKLLAVGVHDAVHIHEWPSLAHKASIRWALHAVFQSPAILQCRPRRVWLAC